MAVETIIVGSTDGPTLTTAARNSCIPTAERRALFNNMWFIGRAMRIQMSGRISCAVTTPGTARIDVCLGSAGTVIVYDTLALNLNIVAKTTVPWNFDVTLVCRAVGAGTSTTFFPTGPGFQSEAVVGAALPAAGTNGLLYAPVGTPAVGAGTDNTAVPILDCFFTQTVATGSFTVHNYIVQLLN